VQVELSTTSDEQSKPVSVEPRQKTLERRIVMTPRVKDRVANLFENVKARITAVINRLENITQRLESRIQKLEANGVDTSAATSHVHDARVALDDARGALNNATHISIERIVDAASPLEQFTTLRSEVMLVREALGRANVSLNAAVTSLANAPLEGSANATTTSQ
jgi:exonuclease VII small subunit